MKFEKQETLKRRAFLKSGVRYLLFGGLVFGSFSLGTRKKTDPQQTGTCQLPTLCSGCEKFNGCDDPRAITYKKAGTKNTHSNLNGADTNG